MYARCFTELDLPHMLARAAEVRFYPVRERWVIETRWRGRTWHIVVEPDEDRRVGVVVTAFPVSGTRR
jgi:hypothetical protein